MSKIRVNTVDYRQNADLKKTGLSFHWWDAEWTSMHNHNFYEFFIITHGKTRHEINGTVTELSKNTFCMICPEDCHQFTKLIGFECIHINLCATTERLRSICEAFGVSLLELASNNSPPVTLSNEEMAFFMSRAEQIGLLRRSGTGDVSIIVCELISEAVAILCKKPMFLNFNCPAWFTVILEKIHSPENLCCTAADIYRLGGFSPPAMIGYFKKYTGKTVTEYLKVVKLDYAGEMLQKSELNVLEISARIGYDSLSHFNRIFKQYAGCSPGQFRRMNRKVP